MASTIWFTGIPGSGKTTLASILVKFFRAAGSKAELLDGDEIRSLVGATGFSREDRRRNVLSAAYTALLLNRNGISVAAAFVSPHAEARAEARRLIGRGFVEIFVDCPLAVCVERDPKGLYKKSIEGRIKDLTGVDDPYERPVSPDLVLRTDLETSEKSAGRVASYLKENGLL